MTVISFDLAQLFQAVADTLLQNRAALNQADTHNGNHGDHMVEIFQDAVQAAREKPQGDLAGAMMYASQLLRRRSSNDSAQVYAIGLEQFARQFEQHQVELDDLVTYIQDAIAEKNQTDRGGQTGSDTAAVDAEKQGESGRVLKALLGGLSGWQQAESGEPGEGKRLGMGYLFDLGIAYMQAKLHSENKIEALADAAVSVSPLNRVPYRSQSGKIAIQALLQAMREATPGT